MAYELIETIEVGAGGAASIEFTSIPQDGTDLVLIISARSNASNFVSSGQISLNTVGGSTGKALEGNGGSVTSFNAGYTRIQSNAANSTANTFNNANVYISNYTGSSVKSVSVTAVTEHNGSTTANQSLFAGSHNVTSAVTSLTYVDFGNTILEYSTFSLYKITAA